MKPSELKRGRKLGWGKVLFFVIATAAAWFWLGRMERDVAWLTVDAPRQAVAGELLSLRIQVASLPEASLLCVDLHWAGARDSSNGYLASGGAKPVGKDGGQFDFEIMVRATNGLRFVNGVVFLSPTGEWSNHTFVATTELIPVTSEQLGGAPRMIRLPLRQQVAPSAGEAIHPTAMPRLLTGLLFLIAAVVAWTTARRISSSQSDSTRKFRRWLTLAAALTVAGLWELLGIAEWVGSLARALARAEDLYYPRAVFQKAVISSTMAATLVFLRIVWRKCKPYQFLLFSFGLYLAISIVNLLSFHLLDVYAGHAWHGIAPIEMIKLGCAAAILTGVSQARPRSVIT